VIGYNLREESNGSSRLDQRIIQITNHWWHCWRSTLDHSEANCQWEVIVISFISYWVHSLTRPRVEDIGIYGLKVELAVSRERAIDNQLQSFPILWLYYKDLFLWWGRQVASSFFFYFDSFCLVFPPWFT
jgi:hypothetical protein